MAPPVDVSITNMEPPLQLYMFTLTSYYCFGVIEAIGPGFSLCFSTQTSGGCNFPSIFSPLVLLIVHRWLPPIYRRLLLCHWLPQCCCPTSVSSSLSPSSFSYIIIILIIVIIIVTFHPQSLQSLYIPYISLLCDLIFFHSKVCMQLKLKYLCAIFVLLNSSLSLCYFCQSVYFHIFCPCSYYCISQSSLLMLHFQFLEPNILTLKLVLRGGGVAALF
jgi:hypothetical protein